MKTNLISLNGLGEKLSRDSMKRILAGNGAAADETYFCSFGTVTGGCEPCDCIIYTSVGNCTIPDTLPGGGGSTCCISSSGGTYMCHG